MEILEIFWNLVDAAGKFYDSCVIIVADPGVLVVQILLKQETVSGSGISWVVCKSAPRSRQITTPAPPPTQFFTDRMPFLLPNQQRQSTEGKYVQ